MQTPGEQERQEPSEGGPGRVLAGRYRVTARLGRGGMGVVWRAVDEVLGREVALKELRTYADAATAELADLRTRMQREARAAARVRHPGVIAVHDVTQHEGRPVIVMELVDGTSLEDVLHGNGPLDPVYATSVGARVLDALGAAHEAGVLHRDVKPGNILLERTGRVVLTDFGIAAMEDPDDGSATRLTGSGELVGSLDYLAPERARGEQPGPASDVWSLGATLYAAVEGASPFRRTSTWSTLAAIVTDPLPEPRRAGALGPALAELLHKDPALRADARRAAALLDAVAAGDPLPPPPPDPGTMRLGPTAATSAPGASGTGFPAPLTGNGAGAGNGPVPPGSPAPPPAGGAPADGGDRTVNTPGPGGRRGRGPLVLLASVAALLLLGSGVAAYSFLSQESADTKRPSDTARQEGSGAGQGNAAKPGPSRSASAAPQACSPAGAGKHNCEVWQSVTTYDAAHKPAGTLEKGTNYFYCQQNLGRRETHGEWTNVWWAKTDDDKGNTNVFVSDVYLEGGNNDEPVPGLPVC